MYTCGEIALLGSLNRAAERIVASLRNWGVLAETERCGAYAPQREAFPASSTDAVQAEATRHQVLLVHLESSSCVRVCKPEAFVR